MQTPAWLGEVCHCSFDFFLMKKTKIRTADLDLDLVLRDVKSRGRDVEGVVKQWMAFVKPNFERYVNPQRKNAGKRPCP